MGSTQKICKELLNTKQKRDLLADEIFVLREKTDTWIPLYLRSNSNVLTPSTLNKSPYSPKGF